MLQKYEHLSKAFVSIEKLKWSRIVVQGTPHKHAFVRDGDEKVTTEVEVSTGLIAGVRVHGCVSGGGRGSGGRTSMHGSSKCLQG